MIDEQFSTIAKLASVSSDAHINHPVNLAKNVEIHAQAVIGKFTFINQYSVVYGKTTIGKYCTIARNCEIGVANHPLNWLSTLGNFKPYFPKHPDLGSSKNFHNISHPPTTIGHDVWLGCGVTVKSGVTIGNGAIIAAGAVVSGDIEPYGIYGGIPARLIRYRFDEQIISDLEELKWWDLDTKQIALLPRNEIEKCIEIMKSWSVDCT